MQLTDCRSWLCPAEEASCRRSEWHRKEARTRDSTDLRPREAQVGLSSSGSRSIMNTPLPSFAVAHSSRSSCRTDAGVAAGDRSGEGSRGAAPEPPPRPTDRSRTPAAGRRRELCRSSGRKLPPSMTASPSKGDADGAKKPRHCEKTAEWCSWGAPIPPMVA
jgi:hypothetical protein